MVDRTLIAIIHGGLGNQLFQVANGLQIAKTHNATLKLFCRNGKTYVHGRISSLFSGIEKVDNIEGIQIIRQRGWKYVNPLIEWPHNKQIVAIEGYFQSDTFFIDVQRELLTLFEWGDLNVPDKLPILHPSRRMEKPTIALHIRRGDYVGLQKTHPLQTKTYYMKAVEQMPPNSHIVIFSDDLKWCRAQPWLRFEGHTIYFPTLNVLETLWAMIQCTHHIIANSTLSWWGAVLAQVSYGVKPLVISPSQWFGPNLRHDTSDMYLSHWWTITSCGGIEYPSIPWISICVPCYEMGGRGVEFLSELFKSIESQTYPNIEVVVSDHSENNDIEYFCREKEIKYIHNREGGGSASNNTNRAIDMSMGSIIKPLFQDDKLQGDEAAQHFITDTWTASFAIINDEINNKRSSFEPSSNVKEWKRGRNTLGGPSSVSWKRNPAIRFHDSLINLMDLYVYIKLYNTYGDPKIEKTINIITRLWKGSVTNTVVTGTLTRQEGSICPDYFNL